MLTEDWMLRQVETLARSIAYLVFQKEDTRYVPTGAEEDAPVEALHRRLRELVDAGDIGGAEDLLFRESDLDELRYLELAVDFYSGLNGLTDAQLRAADFEREELQDGLRNLAGQYGVALP